MKTFTTQFSRLFVGILFIISGLIKLNDPLGFSYKLDEYFPNPYWKRYQPTLTEINTFNLGVYETIDIRPGNISGLEPNGGQPYYGFRCPGTL